MNRLIRRIACAVMAFTLMAGVLTGCKANKTSKVDLPQFTSVKDAEGNLPEKGKINDMEYSIINDDCWHGFKTEDAMNVNSVTKGVVALLAGIALDRG